MIRLLLNFISNCSFVLKYTLDLPELIKIICLNLLLWMIFQLQWWWRCGLKHISWQLEGTHRVRTHAALLLTLTLTLTLTFAFSTQNHTGCRISQGHSLYQAWTICDFRVKCEKFIYWPCDLDLWPLKYKTVTLLGYLKIILRTKFEHFRVIRFRVMLRTNKQTDRQTERQKTSNIPAIRRPT